MHGLFLLALENSLSYSCREKNNGISRRRSGAVTRLPPSSKSGFPTGTATAQSRLPRTDVPIRGGGTGSEVARGAGHAGERAQSPSEEQGGGLTGRLPGAGEARACFFLPRGSRHRSSSGRRSALSCGCLGCPAGYRGSWGPSTHLISQRVVAVLIPGDGRILPRDCVVDRLRHVERVTAYGKRRDHSAPDAGRGAP